MCQLSSRHWHIHCRKFKTKESMMRKITANPLTCFTPSPFYCTSIQIEREYILHTQIVSCLFPCLAHHKHLPCHQIILKILFFMTLWHSIFITRAWFDFSYCWVIRLPPIFYYNTVVGILCTRFYVHVYFWKEFLEERRIGIHILMFLKRMETSEVALYTC